MSDMKKLFFVVILVFVAVACNKKYADTDAGFGSLKISAITDRSVISIQSRAVNLNPETYFLTLQSDKGIAYSGPFPEGGILSNLPAGTYVGKLSSEAETFAEPAFDTPFYAATVNNIVITSGGTTSVEFVCKQMNAGVKFVYDPSLAAAGYGNIVPVITQSGHSLSYSGDNLTATGYFTAGNATLTLLNNDIPVQISKVTTEIPLTLMAKELWTITLMAVMPPTVNSTTIVASVDVLDIIDRTLDITIDPTYVPLVTLFSENFARCTGPNYPIAGEIFSTSGTGYTALTSESAIANAGLTGWTFVSGYTCKNGLKMGITATFATATTPPLTAIGETPTTITLTFMAANWETTQKGLKIDVIGAGSVGSPVNGIITLPVGTANGATISEASEMKQYTVVINDATQDTQIVFSPASTSGNNRYFLANVVVTTGGK